MSVIQLLIDTNAADRELTEKNERLGDNAELPRDLEFALDARTEESIASYVTSSAPIATDVQALIA